MKKVLFLILVVVYSCNCSTQSSDYRQWGFKDSAIVVPSKEIDLGEYDILSPSSVIRYKGWTFFLDKGMQNCLKAVSPDFKKSIQMLKVGNGPCDLSNYRRFFVNNDSLFIFDPNLHKILNVSIVEDSIRVNPYCPFKGSTGDLTPIANSRFISTDIVDSSFFKVIDLEGFVYFRHPYLKDEDTVPKSVS